MKVKDELIFYVIFVVFFAGISCATGNSTLRDGSGDGLNDSVDYTGDCPAGLTFCGGVCVDTLSNYSHCGICNNECQPFETCRYGACLLECPTGEVACSEVCVDINSDVNNCGECGKVCNAGLNAEPVCSSGTCSSVCKQGWSDTDGDGDCESCSPTGEEEICNGVDDNCDGNVDEGFECPMGSSVNCTTSCNSTGTGICSLDCSIPNPDSCVPPSEVCNGIDDDCDGAPDNGFYCTIGEIETGGSCGAGGHLDRRCLEDCNWGAWECVDEGDCTPGETRACGNCGTQVCTTAAIWGDCISEGECSPGASQSQSCGNCGTQTRTCTGGCIWGPWGSCTDEGICGDGIVCPESETCDDGYNDDCGSCNASCSGPGSGSVCGDGVLCPETEDCEYCHPEVCPNGCNSECLCAASLEVWGLSVTGQHCGQYCSSLGLVCLGYGTVGIECCANQTSANCSTPGYWIYRIPSAQGGGEDTCFNSWGPCDACTNNNNIYNKFCCHCG